MYQLGKQFIVNTDKIMADDKAVVWYKYRFSVFLIDSQTGVEE